MKTVDILDFRRRAQEPTSFEKRTGLRPIRRPVKTPVPQRMHVAPPYDPLRNSKANPNRSYSYKTNAESFGDRDD